MWNEFLPISMPITAGEASRFCDMACSFVFGAPCQHSLLAGREHGRTIPLAVLAVAAHRDPLLLNVQTACSGRAIVPLARQPSHGERLHAGQHRTAGIDSWARRCGYMAARLARAAVGCGTAHR